MSPIFVNRRIDTVLVENASARPDGFKFWEG